MSYLFQCFSASGGQLQVSAPTREEAFRSAATQGAQRIIDGTGSVYVLLGGNWTFFGTSIWTQVAGSRAGGQHFSLIEPPK